MPIFDDGERVDIEPAGHLVAGFDYLNASARPEAARVRGLLEDLMSRYAESNRAKLTRRIQSRDERLHRSAVFELILHELLLRRGFQICEIEPEVGNGRAPDFLVEACDGSRFYLEATIAWGEAAADPGADRRLRDALQAIDDVNSPDFFLSLHTRGMPARTVSIRRLRRDVQAFIDKLVYDAVVEAAENNRPAPVYQAEFDGLHILIKPIPKNSRGAGDAPLEGECFLAGWFGRTRQSQRRSEGRPVATVLDLPYIVAVNVLETFANYESVIDALFGTEAVVARRYGHECVRNPDGVWYGRGGPTYSRVSAVLSTERLSAWDIGQRSLRLIHNPWTTKPLPELPLGVQVAHVKNDILVTTPGATLRELFELPDGWPNSASRPSPKVRFRGRRPVPPSKPECLLLASSSGLRRPVGNGRDAPEAAIRLTSSICLVPAGEPIPLQCTSARSCVGFQIRSQIDWYNFSRASMSCFRNGPS